MVISKTEYIHPIGSKFFYGETVMHKGDGKFYTICDLSNYEENYYGMWPLGFTCAIPTHGSTGDNLQSISEQLNINHFLPC